MPKRGRPRGTEVCIFPAAGSASFGCGLTSAKVVPLLSSMYVVFRRVNDRGHKPVRVDCFLRPCLNSYLARSDILSLPPSLSFSLFLSQATTDVHRYRLRSGKRRRLVGEEGLEGEHLRAIIVCHLLCTSGAPLALLP